MTRTYLLVKQLILLGLVTFQVLFIFQLRYELYKAQVCNRVFQVYLQTNYGIDIDLDKLYQDGIKWIN